jgi:hypothetical protein
MKPKFLVGGAVIALALGYMIWAGRDAVGRLLRHALASSGRAGAGKAYRLGGW